MKKPKLFLLHFAGGNSYSFNFLLPYLKEFDVLSLELPGRGRRITEQLILDYEAAVTDYYTQITNKLDTPDFIIYGHSMGASLGLGVTARLEKQGTPPLSLIVSGNPGPGVVDTKRRYLLEKDNFIEELIKLGGIPPELLESEELLDFFEPILRADFEVAEKHKLEIDPLMNTSIYAIMGDQEEESRRISNWTRYTNTQCDFEVWKGDHFFIREYPKEIASIINNCYQKVNLAL